MAKKRNRTRVSSKLDAQKFFDEHRKEMLEGTEILWEDNEAAQRSAYEHTSYRRNVSYRKFRRYR